MSKRNVLFILTLAGLLFAFSLGVLTSRTAEAQIRVSENYFPRESDLWSFSADGQNTYWDDEIGNKGHLLTVERDRRGRLPVLTTTHLRYGLEIHQVIKGVSQRVWIEDPPPPTYNNQSTGFGNTNGVVLQPGQYLVMRLAVGTFTPEDKYLLLSGYWANR